MTNETPNTNNARTDLDDAVCTFFHRFGRFKKQETTQTSAFNALNDIAQPAVSDTLTLSLCLGFANHVLEA